MTLTARDPHLIKLVETYAKEQGMFAPTLRPVDVYRHPRVDLSVVPSISVRAGRKTHCADR
jgi:hypothetical protein